MIKFELSSPASVTLAHVNLRVETHGDTPATAIDLKFVRETRNADLGMLHPMLLDALYYRSDATEAQEEITDIERILPNLRLPQLQTLAWQLEMTGCRVEIDYGLGDDESNIVLTDCKVNGFKIDAHEGGTVAITFRVQTSHIPDGALDKLSGLLAHETAITLTQPEAVKAIDGTTGHPGLAAQGSGDMKDATQTFIDGVTA